MKFLHHRRRQHQPLTHRRTRRSGASWARTSPCTSATCSTLRTSTERCSVRREFNSSVTARLRIDGVTVATRRHLTPSPRRRERRKEHATNRSKRRVLGQQGQRAARPLERGRERIPRLAHLRVLRRRFEGDDAAAAHSPGLQVRKGPHQPSRTV